MNKDFILCRNIKIPLTDGDAKAHDALALEAAKRIYDRTLYGKLGKADFSIYKKSTDARKKDDIRFIYTVCAKPCQPIGEKAVKSALTREFEYVSVDYPEFERYKTAKGEKPVVVGLGPSGMFCALALARAGLCPTVLERGSDVDKRTEKVNEYWQSGRLCEETNVQFGEGGAGTFSDGKLLTRISDALSGYVLNTFCDFGAPSEIKYLAKPHIGTDLLRDIVKNIRNEIVNLGGKILFDTKLCGINTASDGRVKSVRVQNGEDIECTALFLCIGHSARDTFGLLLEEGIEVVPKDFSVGVRIEHLQSDIDEALYGRYASHPALEKGQYALSAKRGGRAVYSFCMCPGGTVVASASENGQIVTNGMSNYKRDGANANSAIAVSVSAADYGNTVRGAMEYQENIEGAAFSMTGGAAPVQTVGDFLSSKSGSAPGRVIPSYTGKTHLCDIRPLFPEYVNDMLEYGLGRFEENIRGFAARDAILTAPETRTSSPVRILRDENRTSLSCRNIYPSGEGAGYAGGITSAAVDGLRCAISYLEKTEDKR